MLIALDSNCRYRKIVLSSGRSSSSRGNLSLHSGLTGHPWSIGRPVVWFLPRLLVSFVLLPHTWWGSLNFHTNGRRPVPSRPSLLRWTWSLISSFSLWVFTFWTKVTRDRSIIRMRVMNIIRFEYLTIKFLFLCNHLLFICSLIDHQKSFVQFCI